MIARSSARAPRASTARLPPRWRVVLALFAVTACISTSVSAFGVFLPVLSETFGWSRGAISVALTINLIVGGIAAFGVAGVADRHGPRGVLLTTVVIGASGFVVAAAIDQLWQFYLVYGVMVGVGMSSIYVLSTATVSQWFAERRGMALAVVLSGFNLGWLVGGPVAAFMIRHWGWRAAYVGLGALVASVAGPATLGVRYPEHALPPRTVSGSDRRITSAVGVVLRDARLWLLVACWFAMGLVFMTVTVHSVPFAKDRGLPLERASLLLTAYGIGAAVGRLLSGAVADRLGAVLVVYGGMLAQAAAVVVLIAGPPAWALTLVLVAFGVGAAGADNAFVKMVPDAFGLAALASIMSILGLGWRCGAGIGPAAAGFLYDASGSYRIPFACALVILVLGTVLFALGTRARPR